jgi:hypothetical protein
MSPPLERPVVRVHVETRRYRMEGEVMLPPEEGYRSRLSDFLNDPQRDFLIVLNATLVPWDDPDAALQASVVMLHRTRIELIIPLD